MSEAPEKLPLYNFSSEEIKHANNGDVAALAGDHIDERGGYPMEGSIDALIESEIMADQAYAHGQRVVQGVAKMYDDAYAEHDQRKAAGSEKQTSGL